MINGTKEKEGESLSQSPFVKLLAFFHARDGVALN